MIIDFPEWEAFQKSDSVFFFFFFYTIAYNRQLCHRGQLGGQRSSGGDVGSSSPNERNKSGCTHTLLSTLKNK